MPNTKTGPATVDEYIAQAPKDVQPILRKIRATIRKAAPDATEKISYQMPGFYLNGQLVWFGVHKTHIGFYPTGEGIKAFEKKLSKYQRSKGAVQFPLDQPIPYGLITEMVRYRVAQNSKKK